MHVLVTGGTGVVGVPAVNSLLARGHTVRLFSRNADRDQGLWESGVEPYRGSVGDPDRVRGAAQGCDAVLHIAGVVDEAPPEVTFEKVNVGGTRAIVEEAARAGVRRLVYVSSLGADRGRSDYHRSKLAGEEIARGFPGSWLVCRPGNVYGPGDEVISLLLKLVRTVPLIPVIGGGDQEFQPVWGGDVGEALALAVERDDLAGQTLELAGDERVTMSDLLDMLEEITDRRPQRIPLPGAVALMGAEIAERIGLDTPVNADQIQMLLEENVILPGSPNALTEVFGITPVALRGGLARLADSLPEKLPSDGVGEMHRQRYWIDIVGSRLSARELFDAFRRDFAELAPAGLVEVGAEPGTARTLEEGATLTLAVPLRGHIQVRVEEVEDLGATCVTLEGHHLAGVIRFLVSERDPGLRFEIRSYARASHLLDSLGMAAVGRRLQRETWRGVVEEVCQRCAGEAPGGVQEESQVLDESDAEEVERWVEEIVMRRKRERENQRTVG
jgi:uncharacterized protein YbjT (DUF2867 family)